MEIKINKRIDWIDQTRGLLFVFVIMYHTRLTPEWLKVIYAPFFLASFFVLSGYLHKKRTFFSSLKSLFNGIIIPIILYSIILCGLNFLHTHDCQKAIDRLFDLLGGGDRIWFLPCLVLVEFTYLLLERISDKYAPYVAICLACVMFNIISVGGVSRGLWCWDVASYSIGYFGMGVLLKDKLFSSHLAKVCIISYIIVCLILGHYDLLKIDMHLNKFSSPIAFAVMSVWGTISFISLMQYLPTQKYICEFGRYTLFLFPFHGYILEGLLKISERFNINANISFWFIVLICFSIGLFLARYIYKYIPALGGKKKWF